MRLKINDLLQWAGTICIMAMYALMNLNLYPWNIIAGMLGSLFYFSWTVRVANKPQMLVNAVGFVVCVAGLIKAFG